MGRKFRSWPHKSLLVLLVQSLSVGKMILTAHQPSYLPWLGLLHKCELADQFCVLDEVQFSKGDFVNRNRIKTSNGPIWLTVPVERQSHIGRSIGSVQIIQDGWQKKHALSVKYAYSKAPFFKEYFDQIEDLILRTDLLTIADLDMAWLRFALKNLNISVELINQSDREFVGDKSSLLLDMSIKTGATGFLFGSQGKAYADVQLFEQNSVKPYFQEYIHPKYSQINGDFVSNMSFIDLLMNEGMNSRDILLSGNLVSLED